LANGYYYWRVRPHNDNGWGPYSGISEFAVDIVSGIDSGDGAIPSDYKLYQNHPNPFNASTRIAFQIPYNSKVKIEIFDITGALVATLVDSQYSAGVHTIIWQGINSKGESLASGVYLYKLTVGDISSVRRMILLK
jgi:hypothetical protein